MSHKKRKEEKILYDIHSAEARINTSEIIDLEKELEINKTKEKIQKASKEIESIEISKEKNKEIKKLKDSVSKEELLIYFDNTILNQLKKIDIENTWEEEIKLALLTYFKIDKKEIDRDNIEIIYNNDWKGITIKAKSIKEKSLIEKRVKTKRQDITDNREFISYIEEQINILLNNQNETISFKNKEDAKEKITNKITKTCENKHKTNITASQKKIINAIVIKNIQKLYKQ